MPETITIKGKTYLTVGDAAFAHNLDGTDFGGVLGYYGGPQAYHAWTGGDWGLFSGYKFPAWVGGWDGAGEGKQAVAALKALRVPTGKYTVLDMEARVDRTYVENFGRVLQSAGYKVCVYGSVSTVFKNPLLNGYWIAWYRGIGPFMYAGEHVRATQYANGERYDSSLCHMWLIDQHLVWQ